MDYVAPKVHLVPNAIMATTACSSGQETVEAWEITPGQATTDASSAASSSSSSMAYTPSGVSVPSILGIEIVKDNQSDSISSSSEGPGAGFILADQNVIIGHSRTADAVNDPEALLGWAPTV